MLGMMAAPVAGRFMMQKFTRRTRRREQYAYAILACVDALDACCRTVRNDPDSGPLTIDATVTRLSWELGGHARYWQEDGWRGDLTMRPTARGATSGCRRRHWSSWSA